MKLRRMRTIPLPVAGEPYIRPEPMDAFERTATDKTPYVRFAPGEGRMELRGCSIHENADRFFMPLIDAVEAYARSPRPRTTARIALTYFNSSSAKYLLDLLKVLDEIHAAGAGEVSVEWVYDEGDLDMQEAGEDFKDLLDLPLKLVAMP